MGEPQARARRQQKVEELCAAALRALAAEPGLHFRGRRLHHGEQRLPALAPHLGPATDDDDFGSLRGAADGIALRLTRSDLALHARLAPAAPIERWIFDLLEQYRAESLAPPVLRGMARNLRHRHASWALACHRDGMTETAAGLLLYTVAQVCRARLTAEPVLEETDGLIETTRGALMAPIGHALAGLRRDRRDQEAFARHALEIAGTVAAMVREAAVAGLEGSAPGDAARAEEEARRALAAWLDADPPEEGGGAGAGAGGGARALPGEAPPYRVFTRRHDRELRAGTLVRRAELAVLRERLDARIAAQGANLPMLARALQALLATPERDGWEGGLEEGVVDGRRLAQLVASPAQRRLFRAERLAPRADWIVTVLIDCSGSMKPHAESVAMIVDLLGRALEMAGAATEILGFTTGAWNGGRAMREWQRAGRPPAPGRLNEVCHLVFKDADTPWRRARPEIAALLRGDLFREGIDGEAVDWACARMAGRPEPRRLLVVVSDGCPMDGATALANGEPYLEAHLREVVLRREREGFAIRGVGVGLDLSACYGRSQVLDLAGTPGNRVFGEILRLFEGRRLR